MLRSILACKQSHLTAIGVLFLIGAAAALTGTWAASVREAHGAHFFQSGNEQNQSSGDSPASVSKSDEARQYPSLPGALHEPPDWLTTNAAFDVAAYFAALRGEDNGATLYLDALFEFSPSHMKNCVSPKEWAQRGPELQARERRVYDLNGRSDRQNTATERAQIVEEYRQSFEKLALAQSQKSCIFETGLGPREIAGEPLVAPRRVGLLLEWRVESNVASRKIDRAIDAVEIALRLSRDLRPRGALVRQAAAQAIDAQTLGSISLTVLSSPEITSDHCGRVMEIVARHRRDGIDPLAEGFRVEYLVARNLLHRLESDPKFRAELELNDALAAMTPDDFASEVAALNRYFRPLIDRGNRPGREIDQLLPDQIRALADMKILRAYVAAPVFRGLLDWDVKGMLGTDLAVYGYRRSQTRFGAVQCLIGLRRWQLEHGGSLPPDLATVCRAAGLESVPIDEFSPSRDPLRSAVRDGEFLVYSVAADGKDDHAKVEGNGDIQSNTGDWVFRLTRSRAPE